MKKTIKKKYTCLGCGKRQTVEVPKYTVGYVLTSCSYCPNALIKANDQSTKKYDGK